MQTLSNLQVDALVFTLYILYTQILLLFYLFEFPY